MSHGYLLELYAYIGERKGRAMQGVDDKNRSLPLRKSAEGADAFLQDAMDFMASNYHGKLPKRLRIKHPPEMYLPT